MELTIDTASPVASIALTEAGALRAELTWQAGRGHAAELMPAIERLLASAGTARGSIHAVFVNRGPGGYAGLRVGVSTALAIASALEAGLLGYGRLEADALPFLGFGHPVVAIHEAGRGDYAWAVYAAGENDSPVELTPPALGDVGLMRAALPADALVVGDGAPVGSAGDAGAAPMAIAPSAPRRAGSAAALAWSRYAAGARDDRQALTPIYLRAPNITAPRVQRAQGAQSPHQH